MESGDAVKLAGRLRAKSCQEETNVELDCLRYSLQASTSTRGLIRKLQPEKVIVLLVQGNSRFGACDLLTHSIKQIQFSVGAGLKLPYRRQGNRCYRAALALASPPIRLIGTTIPTLLLH